ncbi:MAG: hypothetical protein Q4G02_00355 [bacterium]|nr:hypothetical protein [bacterium]
MQTTKLKKIWTNLANSLSFWLICLFVFGLSIRLFNLNIPFGITHDELDYVLNAKWLSLSGSDLTQTWSPWKLQPIVTETLTAELTPVVYSWLMPLISFDLSGVRLISSLIGALLPLALVWWLLNLKVDRKTALLSGLIFTLNPWNLNFSHQLYEGPLSLLFLLVGLTLLAKIFHQFQIRPKQKRLILVVAALIAFAFCYFTYHGNNFLLWPFVFVQLFWLWKQKWSSSQKEKPGGVRLAGLIVLAGVICLYGFSFINRAALSTRASEIIFLNQEPLTEMVNEERFTLLDNRLNKIFSNKFVAGGSKLMENFLAVFDPNYWFWDSVSAPVLGLADHGWFYAGEFFLLIFGIFSLTQKSTDKNLRWLIAGCTLAAMIPALITATKLNLVFRASFLIPIICFLIALGIEQIFSWTPKNWRWLATTLLILFYIVSFAYWQWYSHQRYPFLKIGTSVFHERLVSDYIARQNVPTVVVAEGNQAYALLRASIFYQQGKQVDLEMIEQLAPEMNKVNQNASLSWQNLTFTADCTEAWQLFEQGARLIIKTDKVDNCHFPLENYTQEILSSPVDSGAWYVAIEKNNNLLCQNYATSDYIYNHQNDDYQVETLDDQTFCAKWLLKQAPITPEN